MIVIRREAKPVEPETSVIFSKTDIKDSQALELFISRMIRLFILDEGSYQSVNPDDKNAMSLGILQWHGCRAGELLRQIIAGDKQGAMNFLTGTNLYEAAFFDDEFWHYRTADPHETVPLQELLASPPGRLAQDALANRDITTYIAHGALLGLTETRALAYYCDLENQAGRLHAGEIVLSMNARTKKTLENLCIASLIDELMGVNRRKRRLYVYNRILELFTARP